MRTTDNDIYIKYTVQLASVGLAQPHSNLCVNCSYIQTDASGESTLTIPVGNVTVNTELTYQFGVRKGFSLNSPPQDGRYTFVSAYSIEITLVLFTAIVATCFVKAEGGAKPIDKDMIV